VTRALGALLLFAVAGWAQAQTTPEALEWLRKIYQATEKLSYTGTFVYLQGDRSETSRIAHLAGDRGEAARRGRFRRIAHCAVQPPSIGSTAPVIALAASLVR